MNRFFASDNSSGVHPELLAAITTANVDHALAYGEDARTQDAVTVLQGYFGAESDVLFVFGGTGANVLGLSVLLEHPTQSVLCGDTAHLWDDECGAPEQVLSCKLIPIPTTHGKLTPSAVQPHLRRTTTYHAVRPAVLALTQSTEMGTLYTPQELKALCDLAHSYNARVFLDGARLANAAAALDVSLKEITVDAGVDAFSLGGTKNGMLFGEAVVICPRARTPYARHLRKQCTQLPSKMRFIAAQYYAAYKGDLWRQCASTSNAMAQRLGAGLQDIPNVELAAPVETNMVFVRIATAVVAPLQERRMFHIWRSEGEETIVRWVTGFDSTEGDVDAFLEDIRACVTR